VSVSALFGRATCRITLDDEQFAVGRVTGLAVGEFARECGRLQGTLAPRQLLGLFRCLACAGGLGGLADDRFSGVGVLFEIGSEVLVGRAFDDPPNFAVAEFGLGLALELRVRMFDRNNRG